MSLQLKRLIDSLNKHVPWSFADELTIEDEEAVINQFLIKLQKRNLDRLSNSNEHYSMRCKSAILEVINCLRRNNGLTSVTARMWLEIRDVIRLASVESLCCVRRLDAEALAVESVTESLTSTVAGFAADAAESARLAAGWSATAWSVACEGGGGWWSKADYAAEIIAQITDLRALIKTESC